MQRDVIITYLGEDRPGLVERLSKALLSVGGNWLTSRSINLDGTFAGIVRVRVDESRINELEQALAALASEHLDIRIAPVALPKPGIRRSSYHLQAICADRLGIVSEISRVLASLGVNLEELETSATPAPMSGDLTFIAEARLSLPDGVDEIQVRTALETLSDDVMVELTAISAGK